MKRVGIESPLGASETLRWQDAARQDINYHRSQFQTPYQSTKALLRFMESVLDIRTGQALDVGCGAGANLFHLSKTLTGFRWTGIDVAGEVLFPASAPFFEEGRMPVNFVTGDFYRLNEVFAGNKFDLVLSLQTLLTIPSYERAVDQLMAVCGRWLFVSSLFTDFNVDARIEVMDYTWPEGTQGPYYYNIWSLSRFRSFCEQRGCRQFISEDFEMDIDLSPPESNGFGTYTRALENGRRLQFTGPVFEPWKFIAIKTGDV